MIGVRQVRFNSGLAARTGRRSGSRRLTRHGREAEENEARPARRRGLFCLLIIFINLLGVERKEFVRGWKAEG